MATPKTRNGRKLNGPIDLDKMRRLAAVGLPYRSIARECKCSLGYVSQRLSGWYDAQRKHDGMVATPSVRAIDGKDVDHERATR